MDILRGNKRFSTFLVFLGFFIFVCILNWDARYEKPVWDTAAGVFAPAIYLYETGFDFYGLLEEPGFRQAGPNVHIIYTYHYCNGGSDVAVQWRTGLVYF